MCINHAHIQACFLMYVYMLLLAHTCTVHANTCYSFFWQQACGFEYTSKLQRMFQDMSLSKDLNDRFKQHTTASETTLDGKWGRGEGGGLTSAAV